MENLMLQKKKNTIVKRCYGFFSTAFMVVFIAGVTVFAANDTSKAVSNLTATVCNIVTALGVILALWGVVRCGHLLYGHDSPQRNHALLQLIGGILVAVAPQILKSILQGTSIA